MRNYLSKIWNRDEPDTEIISVYRLPVGLTEFDDWSDRIIRAADMPATYESQKFALAGMILNESDKESYYEDNHFVAKLRKAAANQVAQEVMKNIKEARAQRKLEEEQAAAKGIADGEVLPDKGV